jgi:hypothetical protein
MAWINGAVAVPSRPANEEVEPVSASRFILRAWSRTYTPVVGARELRME